MIRPVCDECGWDPEAPDPLTAGMLLAAHHADEHWTERHAKSSGNWYGSDGSEETS